jgi:hypothetical protein
VKRGTTPHAVDTRAFKVARQILLRLEPHAAVYVLRRAPDSNRTRLVRPRTVGINHVEAPASYTLRRPILGANFATSIGVAELAQ